MYHDHAAPIERWSLGRVFAIVSVRTICQWYFYI